MLPIRVLTRNPWWVLLLIMRAASADAAMSYSDTVLVSSQRPLQVFELPFDAPGRYWITATDLNWFDVPLQALSFGVFASTGAIEIRTGAGTLEFYKEATRPVYLQLYGVPAAPRFAGLVSFQGGSVVPLPPSLLLLGSALGAWLLITGRRMRGALRRALGGALLGRLRRRRSDICNTAAMFV